MSTDLSVCKHNQTGFCKYRQQCTKEYNNTICKNNLQCFDMTCTMRHPKKCQTFATFGNFNFTKFAYFHPNDGVSNKVEMLEKEVELLKKLRTESK